MTTPETKVAVLVLDYNGLDDTSACLETLLLEPSEGIRVYVLDNGSARDEAAELRKRFSDPRLQISRIETNVGFAGTSQRQLG